MDARQTMLKNRRQRVAKTEAKKMAKFLLVTLTLIILFSAAGIGAVNYINNSEHEKAVNLLSENKLYNLVEVNDQSINVAVLGSEEPKHTIVTIAGLDTHNFSVFAKNITAEVKDKNKIVLIDRLGHGISDDTSEERTNAAIVEEYRSALKAVDAEAPYILLAHEFGSIYATYWANKYPDEIESIIYLDGTLINDEDYSIEPIELSPMHEMVVNFGFKRVLYNKNFSYANIDLSVNESTCSKYLQINGLYTNAVRNENEMAAKNYEEVLQLLEATNIPKLYISATYGFMSEENVRLHIKRLNEKNEQLGLDQFFDLTQDSIIINDYIDQFLKSANKGFSNNVKPFVKVLGNCLVTRIPGDVKIYEQNPGGIRAALNDYIDYLDGKKDDIYIYYDDPKSLSWAEYRDSLIKEDADKTAPTEEKQPH